MADFSVVEEKYKHTSKISRGRSDDEDSVDDNSSSDEDEDDEGFLATEALDAQISATLQAIRNRDPRVYDEKVTFYDPVEDGDDEETTQKKGKPLYLRDYHRENLLNGFVGAQDTEDVSIPQTFAQEQEELKRTIVKEIHAAADVEGSSSESDEDIDGGGFLVQRARPHMSRASKIEVDVTTADKDPETFLSNFMAARAWVPTDGARFQPLESDEEEEDERAEKFEAAYNLRFEDPQGSNEVLRTYARDIAAAKSVRREEPKGRKKQREAAIERREAEKREREEERARLRKLKIEEMEEKLQKLKKAAGLKAKTLKDEEWIKILDEDWNDDMWESEMRKRFGDDYYAEQDFGSGGDNDALETTVHGKKKKLKKPKWEDDIDITDIVPGFAEEESNKKLALTLSEAESDDESGLALEKRKSSKNRQQERLEKRKAARLQRKKIEDLVDNQLDLDHAIPLGKAMQQSRFRYRETSPTTFGLTIQDILMAPDASLNQFVGLKKMATFRDPEKKRKDKRKLGKKARLREWRRETFGNENGPEITIDQAAAEHAADSTQVDIIEGKKRRKRSKKTKNVMAP